MCRENSLPRGWLITRRDVRDVRRANGCSIVASCVTGIIRGSPTCHAEPIRAYRAEARGKGDLLAMPETGIRSLSEQALRLTALNQCTGVPPARRDLRRCRHERRLQSLLPSVPMAQMWSPPTYTVV